jgi:transmembrane sensor
VLRNTRATTSTMPLREYVTRPGQRETVTLLDGTQLTLAPASRLQLSSEYGRPNRDVTLDGEAVFGVVHDAQHPFTVRAKGIETTDIGTRFCVRAYMGEAAVRVAVADGRVVLSRRGRGRSRPAPTATRGAEPVMAGDVATVTDTSLAITHVTSTPDDLAWADGWLAFRETPMRDAVADLGRWYDVDVRLADPSLATRRITASLHDEPLPKVLSAVALLIDARYEQHGRVVTFYPTRTS